MAAISRRLCIEGIVQGVGFRRAALAEGRRLALAGWVRNRVDGSVEAVVGGPENDVLAFIAWARIGPNGARVERLTVEQVPDAGELRVPFAQHPTA